MKTGQLAGELVCPVTFRAGIEALSLVFSPDSEELACLYEIRAGEKPEFRIVSFSMATGQPLVNHQFADGAVVGSGKTFVREGHRALDGLPDRSGWITNGQSVFDYKTGLRVHKLADPYDHCPSVAVTADRVAIVQVTGRGAMATARLVYSRLPREE